MQSQCTDWEAVGGVALVRLVQRMSFLLEVQSIPYLAERRGPGTIFSGGLYYEYAPVRMRINKRTLHHSTMASAAVTVAPRQARQWRQHHGKRGSGGSTMASAAAVVAPWQARQWWHHGRRGSGGSTMASVAAAVAPWQAWQWWRHHGKRGSGGNTMASVAVVVAPWQAW